MKKLLYLLPLLLFACKPNQKSQSHSQVIKSFGAVLDDKQLIRKQRLIVSKDFLKHSNASTVEASLLTAKGGNGHGNQGGRKDTQPPQINIISPVNGATVSGTINILVSATDNVAVVSVSLYIDGLLKGESSAAPFTIAWNSATVTNGIHTLKSIAKDLAGNATPTSIQVTVNNVTGDHTAPVVNITTPINNAVFEQNVNVPISVNATDNVGVTSIRFSVDGVLLSSGTSNTFTWNSGTVSGPHTITSTAYDAAGNQGSASVSVSVNVIVIPPDSLPSSAMVAMPPVGYQGAEGACVPFAALYVEDAELYYKFGASNYTENTNILSPEFLYDQIKLGSCASGSSLINALNFLTNNGSCLWSSMPYSDQNGCSLIPTQTQITEAANYKVRTYSMVIAQDHIAVKTMLAHHHPLAYTFTVDANYYNATPGYIWNAYSSTIYAPHANALVGYDDSKHAYLAINQWGTGWGSQGYIWIDYDFFDTIAYDLYTISL